MADYSTIKGFTVQSLASDPVATAVEAGTWASGNSMNTARNAMGTSVMAPTSTSLAAGGNVPPGANYQSVVELYDGTSWANAPASLNTARFAPGGVGTVNTACIIAGGSPAPGSATGICESFNGSAWTEVNNLTTARKDLNTGGAGSATAGLLAGGASGPGGVLKVNESWDGTSWSEENDMNTAREYKAQFGTSPASIVAGGYSTGYVGIVESWNGTSWTEVA